MKSTKAPSEKHLETWLLKNWEELDDSYSSIGYGHTIGGQVVVPSGIIDILAYSQDALTVIELKKNNLDLKALAQILRYKRDIEAIKRSVLASIRFAFDVWDTDAFNPIITYTLIGHGIENVEVLIAAHAADIDTMTYQYDSANDEYDFFEVYAPDHPFETYQQYIDSPIGLALKNAFADEVRFKKENPAELPNLVSYAKLMLVPDLREKIGVRLVGDRIQMAPRRNKDNRK